MESKKSDFYGSLDVILKKLKEETENLTPEMKQMVSFYMDALELLKDVCLEQHKYIKEMEHLINFMEVYLNPTVLEGPDQNQESGS